LPETPRDILRTIARSTDSKNVYTIYIIRGLMSVSCSSSLVQQPRRAATASRASTPTALCAARSHAASAAVRVARPPALLLGLGGSPAADQGSRPQMSTATNPGQHRASSAPAPVISCVMPASSSHILDERAVISILHATKDLAADAWYHSSMRSPTRRRGFQSAFFCSTI